jgi:hypothetical protein
VDHYIVEVLTADCEVMSAAALNVNNLHQEEILFMTTIGTGPFSRGNLNSIWVVVWFPVVTP